MRPVPPPELVIFDCDGVLVDSEPISMAVLIEMIGDAGATISEEEAYERFLGKSLASICDILRTDFGLMMQPIHLEGMRERLYSRFARELQPVRGAAAALAALKAMGCRDCVASSSQPERVRLSLSVTGLLDELGGHIFSATMVDR
ncbi:MAG TPA: HAD hydrolase-like protein, partial [Pararhizobium sp.]|nr:HAD hydrolase-like protein [Pararhizobium sp.]